MRNGQVVDSVGLDVHESGWVSVGLDEAREFYEMGLMVLVSRSDRNPAEFGKCVECDFDAFVSLFQAEISSYSKYGVFTMYWIEETPPVPEDMFINPAPCHLAPVLDRKMENSTVSQEQLVKPVKGEAIDLSSIKPVISEWYRDVKSGPLVSHHDARLPDALRCPVLRG